MSAALAYGPRSSGNQTAAQRVPDVLTHAPILLEGIRLKFGRDEDQKVSVTMDLIGLVHALTCSTEAQRFEWARYLMLQAKQSDQEEPVHNLFSSIERDSWAVYAARRQAASRQPRGGSSAAASGPTGPAGFASERELLCSEVRELASVLSSALAFGAKAGAEAAAADTSTPAAVPAAAEGAPAAVLRQAAGGKRTRGGRYVRRPDTAVDVVSADSSSEALVAASTAEEETLRAGRPDPYMTSQNRAGRARVITGASSEPAARARSGNGGALGAGGALGRGGGAGSCGGFVGGAPGGGGGGGAASAGSMCGGGAY